MSATANNVTARTRLAALGASEPTQADAVDGVPDEAFRARRCPIARWYLCPAAGWLAARLAATRIRPVHLTAAGLVFGLAAAGVLLWQPGWSPAAAGLVLIAWLFDRTDGPLARRQKTVSAWGAWLDANVDELADVGWHVALAAAAWSRAGSAGPWFLLTAFIAGKYLFMYGLNAEEHAAGPCCDTANNPRGTAETSPAIRWLRWGYHLPGNADVRVHLVALAMFSGWFTWELGIVAAYYNLRWIVRYVLVARRLGGHR